MVLSEPPAQGPTDVEVRRGRDATTSGLASARIAAIAFGGPIPTEVKPHEPDPNNIELPGVRRRRAGGARLGVLSEYVA